MTQHGGHDKHAGHSVELFRTRFRVCLILTVPVLFWEPMLQDWFGYQAPKFPGSGWIAPVLGTVIFVYGGWVFLQGAVRELGMRQPGMMTLIALAISVAFVYSAAVTLGFEGHALWWELATLVTIMLLGATLDFTITRTVTVLVIACPHALGLAVPLVVAISTTAGARNGLLVRDRRGLEEARNLDVVAFDKTGTLTLGEHRVVETITVQDLETAEALRLAAAVERDSEHPIARALLRSAEAQDIEVPQAEDFQAIAGQGVQARSASRSAPGPMSRWRRAMWCWCAAIPGTWHAFWCSAVRRIARCCRICGGRPGTTLRPSRWRRGCSPGPASCWPRPPVRS